MLFFLQTLLFTFSFADSLPEAQCNIPNSKIIIQTHLKKEVDKSGFCFNPDKFFIYSTNCKNGKCGILKRISNNKDFKKKFSPLKANPAFLKCEAIGGKPQIVQVLINKKIYHTDRCLDESDHSFIHTGFLK